MYLYLNCASDFSIVDEDGKVYTPEQARALWEAGAVRNFNLGFARLVARDFDIEAVRQFFASTHAGTTTMTGTKCEVHGCKQPARWIAHKLWNKGGAIRVCDGHKPDPAKRPEGLRHLPNFYRVEALEGT